VNYVGRIGVTEAVEKQLERANKLIFAKKYDDARKILDDLVKTPDGHLNLLVHLRRIELGLKLQTLHDLKKDYQRGLKKSADDPILNLGLLLVEQHGEMITSEEAIARYQEILKRDNNNAIAYYGIGFSLEMQGNVDRAIFNYERSINLDETWYPSYFGLSQLYYQKGDSKNGDHFFYQFEKSAPYNVYGNFDTHRRLSTEFLEMGRFKEAENAITTLSEWWLENKGLCPPEIHVHEHLAIAKIALLQGDKLKSNSRRSSAISLAQQLLDKEQEAKEGVLYFVARILEEFGEFDTALHFYKKVLRISGGNPAMVQKIGSQFLSLGEYDLAKDLFEDAYQVHPDNSEIRFCVLVSKLKLAGVNVEEYLIGKERLKQLSNSSSDRVEVLALLHSLQAKFQEDPEVHQQMGDIYLRMGNVDRAARHFKTMYALDGKSKASGLRYVAFLMQHGDAEEAMRILDSVSRDGTISNDDQIEINWLRASYYARRQDFKHSQEYLKKILKADPWNVSYLVQEVTNLMQLAPVDEEVKRADAVIRQLSELDETALEWHEYDELTQLFENQLILDVAYARRKIRFLYTDGDESLLRPLVTTACHFDPSQGTYDFLRLINTNFDSPHVYWSLGVLHKELWQLEVASMWFEQCLLHQRIDDSLKAKCYLEIADCSIWLGKDLNKAVEYAKMSIDLAGKPNREMLTVLTHAFLKTGQIKQAQSQLSQGLDRDSVEAIFLNGLIEYRNGARKKANEIWKPLLTVKSDSLRVHNIKQEVLKYYFDGAPYLKVN
jgi:tetratricopeptide (TPR) repeat protein